MQWGGARGVQGRVMDLEARVTPTGSSGRGCGQRGFLGNPLCRGLAGHSEWPHPCILGTHSPPCPGAAAPTVCPAWTCCCGGGRPAVTSLRCCRGEQSQKVRVRIFWDSGPRGCDPRLGSCSSRNLRRCRPVWGRGRGRVPLSPASELPPAQPHPASPGSAGLLLVRPLCTPRRQAPAGRWAQPHFQKK